MKKFFSSRRFKVLASVVAAFLFGVIIAVVSSSNASPFQSVAGIIMKPVQRLSSVVADKMGELNLAFQSSGQYIARIEELEKQIEDYESKLVDYEQMKQKIESYSVMLDVKEEHDDFTLAPANIIGRDAMDAFYSFVIDKGSADGVSVNDPVVYGNYVVGVVHSVKATYSEVWTILNPKVNISAMEARTRESGYTTTTAELSMQGSCMLSGLEQSTQVSVGGIVCTLGIGGVYPKGLIIGKIADITQSEHDISVNAIVSPSIEIGELEDVFIITDFDGQGVNDIPEEE